MFVGRCSLVVVRCSLFVVVSCSLFVVRCGLSRVDVLLDVCLCVVR